MRFALPRLLLASSGWVLSAAVDPGWPGNPELAASEWTARWIHATDTDPEGYGVQHFRRSFDLPDAPARFIVHVSADNRYQLFVNGVPVSEGPARGDLQHWNFETVDLAPHLRGGRNVIASVVWNFAEDAPLVQISRRTGFLLQGDGPAERIVDTGSAWQSLVNPAYSPLRFPPPRGYYYIMGAGEQVDGRKYPWGWEQAGFDDSAWRPATEIEPAAARGAVDSPSRWMLTPRALPRMERTPERFASLRNAEGVQPPEGFPQQVVAWEVPARHRVRLLLDRAHLTTAYPEFVFSQGRGATVTAGYAEGLWIPGTPEKGHRDVVDGKEFEGNRDRFILDGGRHRVYRPLWWRTYRYLEIIIETADEPVVVEDVRGVFTAYPFERRAQFTGGSEELSAILEAGWRTARLCAHETYMDTPYYEQMQYVGDTRIQALVSVFNSGDGRLMRNAIQQIDATRVAEGLTFSRGPTAQPQFIPGFSLWWIGMLHDYWRYQDDPEFVARMLPGVRAVLSYFRFHQKASGSLRRLPWWNFVDWSPPWTRGVPPREADGSSALADLQLLLAYKWAAEMEASLGSAALAEEYRQAATRLRDVVRHIYWSNERGLFADTPSRKTFSQHANALAVLAEVVSGDGARRLMEAAEADQTIAPVTIYFRFYYERARIRAGLADDYLQRLGPWRDMLEQGLTTWAEEPEPSRSDCHAWGSSPNIEVFRTVLGVDSAAPGFRKVIIAPNPGHLRRVAGTVPHPQGEITVHLERTAERTTASIGLPADVTGHFVWAGRRIPLTGGQNRLELDP